MNYMEYQFSIYNQPIKLVNFGLTARINRAVAHGDINRLTLANHLHGSRAKNVEWTPEKDKSDRKHWKQGYTAYNKIKGLGKASPELTDSSGYHDPRKAYWGTDVHYGILRDKNNKPIYP